MGYDGHTMVNRDSESLHPGQSILHYTILGLLAEGGMAEVYLARDHDRPRNKQIVVLKRIRPHLLRDPRFETMFENEAKLATRIAHRNVVQVFELERSDRELLLAMEFLNGKTLLAIGKTCDTGGFWVPHTILARIVADAADGLHRAHTLTDTEGRALNLVHRDMSPENVIVTFDGHAKVVDFGVAKGRSTPDTTQYGVIKGKLNYLAPEAIRGESIDARADIYALGVTLYLFLTARFPITGETTDRLLEEMFRQQPVRPREINSTIPHELESICLRCLATDRHERFETAALLRRALEKFIVDSGTLVSSRHVAAFLDQLYPIDSDPMRRWVEAICEGSAEASLAEAAPGLEVPVMRHGGTVEMHDAVLDSEPAGADPVEHAIGSGLAGSDMWSVVTDIHQRAASIMTNLQASGVHVTRRMEVPSIAPKPLRIAPRPSGSPLKQAPTGDRLDEPRPTGSATGVRRNEPLSWQLKVGIGGAVLALILSAVLLLPGSPGQVTAPDAARRPTDAAVTDVAPLDHRGPPPQRTIKKKRPKRKHKKPRRYRKRPTGASRGRTR